MASRHGCYYHSGHGVPVAKLMQRRRQQQYLNVTKPRKEKSDAGNEEKGYEEERQRHVDSKAENSASSTAKENYCVKEEEEEVNAWTLRWKKRRHEVCQDEEASGNSHSHEEGWQEAKEETLVHLRL